MDTGFYFIILIWSSIIGCERISPNVIPEFIENNAGMYFEKVNELRFIRDEWTYLVYLDFHEDHFNVTKLSLLIESIENLCTTHKICDEHEEELEKLSKQLDRAQHLHFDLTAYLETIVGNSTNTTKLRYDDSVLKLKLTETKFVCFPDIKLHLIRSSLDGFEGRNYKGDENIFETLDHELRKLKKYKEGRNFAATVIEIIKILESYLNMYISLFKGALEVVRGLGIRQTYPSLLNYLDLHEIIENTIKLNHPYQFPLVEYLAHIDVLGAIAEINYGKVNDRLLISFKFPLISDTQFTIYQLKPLPIPVKLIDGNTATLYIEPRSSLLGISKDASYAITKDQIKNCIATSREFLCRPYQPIRSELENNSCEFTLFYRPKNIDYRKCDVRYLDLYIPFWTTTENNRAWIFSLNESTELQINCRKQGEKLTINSTGTLKIRVGCKVVAGEQELTSTVRTYSAANTLIFPQVNFELGKNNSIIETIAYLKSEKAKKVLEIDWTTALSVWELEIKARNLETGRNFENNIKTKLYIILLITLAIVIILAGLLGTLLCFEDVRDKFKSHTPRFPVHLSTEVGEIEVPIEEIFERFNINRFPVPMKVPNLPSTEV